MHLFLVRIRNLDLGEVEICLLGDSFDRGLGRVVGGVQFELYKHT